MLCFFPFQITCYWQAKDTDLQWEVAPRKSVPTNNSNSYVTNLPNKKWLERNAKEQKHVQTKERIWFE